MTEHLPRHSVSVAAAVVNADGQVLVIQRRDNGHWEPPGGVLELDESIEEGVRREIREETRLQVEVVGLTGVYKNMEQGVVALVFRCRPVSGLPGPTSEAAAVAWLDPDEVACRMDEAFAVRISDAVREQAPVAVRSHDGVRLV